MLTCYLLCLTNLSLLPDIVCLVTKAHYSFYQQLLCCDVICFRFSIVLSLDLSGTRFEFLLGLGREGSWRLALPEAKLVSSKCHQGSFIKELKSGESHWSGEGCDTFSNFASHILAYWLSLTCPPSFQKVNIVVVFRSRHQRNWKQLKL